MAYSAMQFAEAARDTANPEHLCRNSRPVQHMLCILRCTENGWIALSRRLWQSARGGGEGGRGGRPAGESGGGGEGRGTGQSCKTRAFGINLSQWRWHW